MGYRGDRQALEQRAIALREEIDELLTRLEERERELDVEEREAFWARADDLPSPAEYLRPTTSELRPFFWMAGIMGGIISFIALMADNPIGERIAGLVVVVLFFALFLGVGLLIVRLNRGRSTDVCFDEDGIRLRGSSVDAVHPWPEVERLRLRVEVTSSGKGSRTKTGYLAVRREGVWSEHVLTGISRETEAAMHRWVDWVLGVRLPKRGKKRDP